MLLRRLILGWFALAVVLVLGGCSGDDSSTSSPDPTDVPSTEVPTDETVAPVSETPDGVGTEHLGDGVTVDVSLITRGGIDFDPNQDVEFVVMVSIEGLEEEVVVSLDGLHSFGTTEQEVTADVLRDPDSFTDGALIEAVPSGQWWSSAELGAHEVRLSGTIAPTGGGPELTFSRQIGFDVTAAGPAFTTPEMFHDGALAVDLPRRWIVMERGDAIGRYAEGEGTPAQIDLGVDDAQMLVDLGGRGSQLTVFRLTRPLLLPDPEVLVDQLPAIVGPGEFSEPEAATVSGFDATRLAGTVNGLDGTWDLLRVGDEYLMIRTTGDGTPEARAEADLVLASLRLDAAAFPRLTHVIDSSFWMTGDDGLEYFTIDYLIPADWRQVEAERGLRFADPVDATRVDLLNFAFDGPIDAFIDQAMPQTGPDDEVERSLDQVDGVDRATVRIVSRAESVAIVAFSDGAWVQVVIAADASGDPDMDLLDAIAASVRPVGPPAA
ncbi:MAG TPA: hypothetical protein VK866_00355 [Acidimicrobiales bacterium]|nr:hypothetical protein [Acidimicrobiales bacterium]